MPQLLAAVLILGLAWYGLKFFANAPAKAVARLVRMGGGVCAVLIGLFLLLRGRPDLGIAGIGVGLWLFGLFGLRGRGWGRPSGTAADGVSRVRSAMIEMELDHASGRMRGTVLAGVDEGRPLDSFTRSDCKALYRLCLRDDPDGARLLEAYLDRRFPGWRDAGEAQRDARAGKDGPPRRSGVSENEAYEILGLGKGATRDDVIRAHRTLMKKLHPDHGGTTDLAARVNEAKDVLLRRAR
jgi:hypothetical protein